MFYDEFHGENKKVKCIIYSDSDKKIKWDIFVCFLLLFCVVVIPYRLAFADVYEVSWEITYYIMDFCFLLDIIISFFTTIPNPEKMEQITDKKKIALNYIFTWFSLDLFSILPIDIMFNVF